MASTSRDLTRTTLGILFIVGMIILCAIIVRPFAASAVWAATLVLATWPWLRRLDKAFGGRRAAAVAVMTLGLFLLFMIPLSMAIAAIARNAQVIIALPDAISTFRIPTPPDWLDDIPLIGESAREEWHRLTRVGNREIVAMLRPYARTMAAWFIGTAGGFGLGLVHVLLTIALAAILYAKGEAAADWCRRFGRRLADARGEEAVVLAGAAIRGVALGVVVTAVVQAILTGIGLALAGVPQAGVLAAVALLLCLAQLGPGLVIFPAVIWLFATGQTVGAIVLLVIGLPTVLADNVLRPILIKRGADLPLLLILIGVIGGLLAFGMIGLFVGPVILAVTHTLLEHWIAGHRNDETPNEKGPLPSTV
jgi:predicted PurR-regulated permease PerM